MEYKCNFPLSCKLSACSNEENYFDVEILKKSMRSVDKLIETIRLQNPNLKNYHLRNNAMKMFNNITLQLVSDFKNYAKSYINHLVNNKHEYGRLYLLATSKKFNLLYIEYMTFPLISQTEKEKIIEEIETFAKNYGEDSFFKITCLELLYFYALLVNPTMNWVIMDYITNGNRNHQYFMLDN